VATAPGKTPAYARAETAERILVVARELFGRVGYDGTTIKQIADRCNISDAAVLYHFRSKQAILEAILVEPEFEFPAVPDYWDPDAYARAIVDIFYAWEPHWPLLRVIFVHALEDHLDSIAFNAVILQGWCELVRPALAPHCGAETDEVITALAVLLRGTLIDQLTYWGTDFEAQMSCPATRAYLERAVKLVLPPAVASASTSAIA
jgi:AcrR family transcriptional regulator